MADQFTSVQHEGFLSRIGKSIMGVFIGLLLIPGSIVLMSWNEYRTIHRTKGLAEGEKSVVEADSSQEVNAELQGKLLHLTGMATTDDKLSDPDFGLEQVAIHFARRVEMYQWKEDKETRTRNKLGGGKETITEYKYRKEWDSDRNSSESFHHPQGHENPPLKFSSRSATANKVQVGNYLLGGELVSSINNYRDLELNMETFHQKIPEDQRSKYRVTGNYLYYSEKAVSDSPEVGDIRIRFQVVEPSTVSVLAGNDSGKLGSYQTSNHEPIESLMVGSFTSTQMFENLRSQNTMLAWILRLVGWVLASVGFGLIAGPITALASIVPFFGNLTGNITTFISFVLGAMVAVVTIGIAWIAVRPVFGIGMLVIAGLGVYLLMRRKKTTQQSSVPPVLQPIE